MGKYDLKTIGLDTFELTYKDQVIVFKRTVALAKRLQGITATARFKMMQALSEMGKTKKDLCIETKTEDGKIIVDETNYKEFEASYIQEESFKAAYEIYETIFKKSLITLVEEMELNQEESNQLGTDIRRILNNEWTPEEKIPSTTVEEVL